MQDLRLFAKELEGKEIKSVSDNKMRVFKIEKVYPMYIKARTKCENGYSFTEGFTIGDLILKGLIDTNRPRYGSAWDYHGGQY